MPVQHTNGKWDFLYPLPCRDIEDRALDAAALFGGAALVGYSFVKKEKNIADIATGVASGIVVAGELAKVTIGANENIRKGFYALRNRK